MINKRKKCFQILGLIIFALDVTDLLYKAYESPFLSTYHNPYPEHTHTHLHNVPYWLLTHTSAPNHQTFLKEIVSAEYVFILIYITLQIIVPNFSMLTMFSRSVSLEQAKKKISGSLLFFHQYIWHHLWRVNKKHTVKWLDQDKMLLFVPHEHRGIFKQRKTFHDSPGTSFSWIIPTCSHHCGSDCVGI